MWPSSGPPIRPVAPGTSRITLDVTSAAVRWHGHRSPKYGHGPGRLFPTPSEAAVGRSAVPTRSSCGDAVPDFEHGAAGRRAIGAMGHAGPTARVVPGPERPPEREVGELAFQQIHLLDVVVGDHAGTTGVQTWPPPYEPRKHSRVIGVPGQYLLLRARLLGLPPRHGVRGEELKLPFHPADSWSP